MHLRYQAQSLLIVVGIGKIHLRHEDRAGIIGISIHGEGCQWKQVDSVTVFKCTQVAIAHRHADNVGNATVVTGSSAHPKDIMVAPLNIKVVIVAQSIHNNVCARPTVIDIAYNMERVNRQTLNQVAHGNDEIIRTLCSNNRADNHIDIGMLIRLNGRFVQ